MLPKASEYPTVSVEMAGAALGLSRASAYEGVRTGEIPSIRIGRRIVIPTAQLRRMLGLDEMDGRPEPVPGDEAMTEHRRRPGSLGGGSARSQRVVVEAP